RIAISLEVILISIVLGILSIYASAFLPALYASRLSPLVAISSRTLISKEKIKRRKSWISGKLFGFEGELAAKNIKRNKKRYRITVFSIVISVALFISFSSFMDMSFNISDSLNESKRIHFSIIGRNKQEAVTIDDPIIEEIKSIATVQRVFKVYESTEFSVLLDKKSEIAQLQNFNGIYDTITWNGTKKTLMKGSIDIYDRASIEVVNSYIKSGSIDMNRLNEENGVIIIDKNRIYNNSTENTYVGPIAFVKVGDEIELSHNQFYNSEKRKINNESIKTVRILAILEDDPFFFGGNLGGLKMISTKEVVERLLGVDLIEPISLKIMMDNARHETETKAVLERIIAENPSLRLINLIDQNRQTKSAILMIKILLYGFVLVVSCIGCVNII
ncbi:MAG: hypothetical protein MI862_07995, partial [Desulfobacterales bacterium]|nr:hypothetical protein [Desulfobacterales bacterium]